MVWIFLECLISASKTQVVLYAMAPISCSGLPPGHASVCPEMKFWVPGTVSKICIKLKYVLYESIYQPEETLVIRVLMFYNIFSADLQAFCL